jgi:hypothetical protein
MVYKASETEGIPRNFEGISSFTEVDLIIGTEAYY